MENHIISLTAHIVSAHVAANNVSVAQLPGLIRDVHGALATVAQAPAEPIKAEPAVAVKKSVFADHILCLDCGASLKMLKRHLASDHDMTPDEYRRLAGHRVRRADGHRARHRAGHALFLRQSAIDDAGGRRTWRNREKPQ